MVRFRRSAVVLLVVLGLSAGSCATFSEAAAVVNGEKITPRALEEEIEQVRRDPAFVEAVRQQGGGILGEQRREALTVLVRLTLLRQEAEALGVEVTEEEIDRFVDEIRASLGGEQQFQDVLERAGITMGRARLLAERQLYEEAVRERVTGELEVSDEALRQAYEANRTSFEEVHLFRITVPSEQEAREIVDQVATGIPFSQLAQQRSTDELAASGGDMGFVAVSDLEQLLQVELQGVPDGGTTEPIPTGTGSFAVYQVRERRARPLEEVRQQLSAQLLQQEREQAFRQWFFERLERAEIVVNPKYGAYDEQSLQIVPAPDLLPEASVSPPPGP